MVFVFTLAATISQNVIFDLFYRSADNNSLRRLLLFRSTGDETEAVCILSMREASEFKLNVTFCATATK